MAILDTFYILFKGDSSDAERALERVNRSANRLDSSLNRVARRWLSLYAIINQAQSAFKHAFDLTAASEQLNVNTSALQAWSGAVQKTGGSLSSFSKAMESLAEHLGTTPKIAMQSLPVLASQFERLNRAQAVKYGKVLGLDLPTILLLQKGRTEVEALVKHQKELGVITEKDAGVFRRFRGELQDTGHGLEYLFLKIALKVIPYIEIFLNKIQEFTIYLQKHSGLIKGALIPITVAIGAFAASLIAANLPLVIMVGGLALLAAAFAIVYDDFQTFQRGGNSVIGELIKKFPELAEVAKAAFNAIKIGFKAILWVFDELAANINLILKALNTVSEWVAPYLKAAFKIESSNGDLLGVKKSIEIASINPIGSPAMKSAINNSRNDRNTTISINEIKIETQATDATEIAYGLNNALEKQLRQAQYEFTGGVLI